jgi:hypothetical protein
VYRFTRFTRPIFFTFLVCLSSPLRAQGYFEYRVAKPEQTTAHETFVAGVRYAIDSLIDAGPAPGVFKTFAAVVEFAHGRGRIDVVSNSEAPVIRANGLIIAPPLGQTGDYYLFDSTSFILVRPAAKTFSSFSLDSFSYNYQDRRDGWPQYFRFGKVPLDTLSTDAGAAMPMMPHGRTQAFWHLDLEVDTSPTRVVGRDSIRILAAGRLTLLDAPLGEFSIARWFGPSEALANLPADVSGLPTGSVRVTAVAEIPSPELGRRPVDFITLHHLLGLKRVAVDLARLKLPDGFSETRWPSFEGQTNLPLSSDNGAKWRALP